MPELLFKECDMNLNCADLHLFYVIWSHFSVQVVFVSIVKKICRGDVAFILFGRPIIVQCG